MIEIKNLFEVYDNAKQLSQLYSELKNNYKDIDTCLKFLNLIQYHKPLFKDFYTSLEYAEMLYEIDYNLQVLSALNYIFEYNDDIQFPEEIYNQYYKFPSCDVRYYIAKNNYTPKNILEEYAIFDASYSVTAQAKIQLKHRFENNGLESDGQNS